MSHRPAKEPKMSDSNSWPQECVSQIPAAPTNLLPAHLQQPDPGLYE